MEAPALLLRPQGRRKNVQKAISLIFVPGESTSTTQLSLTETGKKKGQIRLFDFGYLDDGWNFVLRDTESLTSSHLKAHKTRYSLKKKKIKRSRLFLSNIFKYH